jgi:predicted amidohydrolase YtcJ
MNMIKITALGLVLALCTACSPDEQSSAAASADLLIRNARIWTGVAEQPWVSALAVRGDRILAIGSELDHLMGPGTEVIDSPSGLVVPGFIDSHVHMLESGFELSSVQLRDASTPAEFSQRVAVFARTLAPGQWMRGGTWDHHNWGGQLPHRDWVDQHTPNTPILLVRLDGHMALANSKALELAGIDNTTDAVAGGEIVRDEFGNVTGVLKDNAMELVAAVIPAPSLALQDEALQAAMAYLASHGVTSAHDMGYNWDALASYRRAQAKGTLRTLHRYARRQRVLSDSGSANAGLGASRGCSRFAAHHSRHW